MEVLPVLKVVEVYGVEDGSGVSNAYCGKDGSASGVVVIVGDDRLVVLLYGSWIERAASLVENPELKLSVGRLVRLDVAEECVALDADGVEGHLVEASACRWVVFVKLADGIERGFLPKAREVKNAERACDTGGNSGDNLAHYSLRFQWLDPEAKCLRLQRESY